MRESGTSAAAHRMGMEAAAPNTEKKCARLQKRLCRNLRRRSQRRFTTKHCKDLLAHCSMTLKQLFLFRWKMLKTSSTAPNAAESFLTESWGNWKPDWMAWSSEYKKCSKPKSGLLHLLLFRKWCFEFGGQNTHQNRPKFEGFGAGKNVQENNCFIRQGRQQ